MEGLWGLTYWRWVSVYEGGGVLEVRYGLGVDYGGAGGFRWRDGLGLRCDEMRWL